MSMFTPSQAKKASAFALHLMRERRFFLHEKHCLDPNVFAECIELDAVIGKNYKRVESEAVEALLLEEARLGLRPPVLGKGQSMVRCSLYGGGLDICRIDPLQELLAFAPESLDALEAELFASYHGAVEDIAPKHLPEIQAKNRELSEWIWKDICALRERVDGLVVLLHTKFSPEWPTVQTELAQKVGSFVNAEHGLAYLFYKRECGEVMTILHDYALFSCAKEHLVMCRWTNKPPERPYLDKTGYTCRVYFAFVA